MTKSSELILLEEVIKRFGPNSYLGPVLKVLQPAIERDILSDVVPDVDIERVKRECAELKAAAAREIALEKEMLEVIRKDITSREDKLKETQRRLEERVREVQRLGEQMVHAARYC